MSSLTIQQKGITGIPADAIVNAANSGLWAGGGVCGVNFNKAGMAELTAACESIGHCDERSAVIIPGFACPCKFIIHSVVFPLISAGIFGYPLNDAWKQAIYACKNFIENTDYELDIIFAIPEDEKVKAGNKILNKILNSKKTKEKQIMNSAGILLYEGSTLYGKPLGYGKTFFENGNVYQEGEFGVKGLIKGKEFYPSGKLRFDGIFKICKGYGPNYPICGKCYDEDGNLYYEGEIQCSFSGVGYPSVKIPANYGPIPQEGRPKLDYFMWEDEEKLMKN